jgi:gamma-glutamylcysteine synthetase
MADCGVKSPPITLDEMAAYLASGSKPRADFRVGAEH